MADYIIVFGYIVPSWIVVSISYFLLRENGNSWFSADTNSKDWETWKEIGLLSMVPLVGIVLAGIFFVALFSRPYGFKDAKESLHVFKPKPEQPRVSLMKKKRSKRSHISNGRSTMCGMPIDKSFEESDSHENLCPTCYKLHDGGSDV